MKIEIFPESEAIARRGFVAKFHSQRSVRLLSLPESCDEEVGVWTSKAGTLRRQLSCGESAGMSPTPLPNRWVFPARALCMLSSSGYL